MIWELLGLALWLALAVVGAWLLVTGRQLPFGIPTGMIDGWQLRVFGLLYFVAGVFLAYRVFQGSLSREGIVFAYVSLGILVFVAWRKARLDSVRRVP